MKLLSTLLLLLPLLANAQCVATDGDSLRCGSERIRLANLYAAELHEPGGAEAHARLRALVDGHAVTLQRVGTDKYRRTLALVFVDGRLIEQHDIGPRAGRGSAPRRRRR